MNKYELALETKRFFDGIELYRIRALRSFSDVTEGTLGGYIQQESNLSQEGDCWIYGDAQVCGNAQVFGDAAIYYPITELTCILFNIETCIAYGQ